MKKITIISLLVLSFLVSGLVLADENTSSVGDQGNDKKVEKVEKPALFNSSNSNIDIACVKTAVETRENAISTALDTFNTSVKTSLQTRKTALLAAWSLTDNAARKTAIKAAWKTFNTEYKVARKAFSTTKKTAWNQFSVARKACKASPTGEDQGQDLNL